jgi:prepilin-type N-terminal cleavage/methylation domain-containing protein
MKRHQNGFTLIELVIVMAMTALIATVMLANFRNGDKSKRVGLAADGIVNVARLAQNYAISGKQIAGNLTAASGTRCPTDYTAAYYEVDLDQSSGNVNLYAVDKCGAVFQIDSYPMASGAHIKNNSISRTLCTPTCSTSTFSTMAVRFTPPFGKSTAGVIAGPIFLEFSSIDLVVESTDGARSKSVKIDGISGRIGY